MSNSYNSARPLLYLENSKEVVEEFKKIINEKANKAKFLKIVAGNASTTWLNEQSQLIKQRAELIAPDSSYANRRPKNSTSAKSRLHGKLITEIKQSLSTNSEGVRSTITLNRDIKGYQRGIYFSIIRGYRNNSKGGRIKYKYTKEGAKNNIFNRSYKSIMKNDRNFIIRYVREVFVPEFEKEN